MKTEARTKRAIFPEDVISRRLRNNNPENSQFRRYVFKVTNILLRSGKKGSVRTVHPTRIPIRNNMMIRLLTKINKAGRKINGSSFTKIAKLKTKPADNTNSPFFVKRSADTPNLFGVQTPACFISRKSAINKKKIAAPSIWPEAAISMTGRGCHAYTTHLQAGNRIRASSLISIQHVMTSRTIRRSFIPKTFFPNNEPTAKMIWAAGG